MQLDGRVTFCQSLPLGCLCPFPLFLLLSHDSSCSSLCYGKPPLKAGDLCCPGRHLSLQLAQAAP